MSSRAIVILGHSNSGKTPLGEMIQARRSTAGVRHLHLDFGENLRGAAAGVIETGLTGPDIGFVRGILDGTLLDDSHFYIAEAIIRAFCRRNEFDAHSDVLVLNGIPRHAGQAAGLESMGMTVRGVIFLDCRTEDAYMRKRKADTGKGHEDRSHRTDGDYAVFERKIASFEKETRPLIDYYKSRKIPVITVPVGAKTTPQQAFDAATAAGY
jgi:adenylate kinase